MQVDKFYLSTLLSGYYLSTCIFYSNNSNWGHSTSMLNTSGSVCNLYLVIIAVNPESLLCCCLCHTCVPIIMYTSSLFALALPPYISAPRQQPPTPPTRLVCHNNYNCMQETHFIIKINECFKIVAFHTLVPRSPLALIVVTKELWQK